jgi:hypothetical protein
MNAAAADLKIKITLPAQLKSLPVASLLNQNRAYFVAQFLQCLKKAGATAEAVNEMAFLLADRAQLLLVFKEPEIPIQFVSSKIKKVASDFPSTLADLERGKNPGDVIDPFIVSATQHLVYGSSLVGALEGLAAHKAIMMIEGLVGHLHEDVIGMMRGNLRVPEPRGVDQETFSLTANPFPGADIFQPPSADNAVPRFFQVKNKTGSAKGGDGKRLGDQLKNLQNIYKAETYYIALVGSTLRGHRSMAGVLRASPKTVVLVGRSAFKALTKTDFGAELLLKVYSSAFRLVAQELGYDVKTIAGIMAKQLAQKFNSHTEEQMMESLLVDVIGGNADEQDSRIFCKRVRTTSKK